MPTPSVSALEHSEKLIEQIKHEILIAGGYLDFARFMQLALYAPQLGYYSAGMHKFGPAGDFVTAPEISPLFAKCLAKQFQQVLLQQNGGDILEFGAGSGAFAREVLRELARLDSLPQHYFILEVSAELRERQRNHFNSECPEFLPLISWLDTLPRTPIKGIIFANEVLDAMPVHCFEWQATTLKERCVTWENQQFVWHNSTPNTALKQAVAGIMSECALPDFYQSEVSLIHPAWIASVAESLQQGAIFLLDYGYGRREYYHPERSQGTLTCFYQHHQHSNPLTLLGLQDITAHIDFTQIAENAVKHGLTVAGFTSQAAFLLACDLLKLAEENTGSIAEQYQQSQTIKTLTLPTQMGEVIKVMALTKEWHEPLLGFALQDRRGDL